MKRVITRTETIDNFEDGKTCTNKTEVIEETLNNGLWDAWVGLLLLLITGVLFGLTLKLLYLIFLQQPSSYGHTYVLTQVSQTTQSAVLQRSNSAEQPKPHCRKRCRIAKRLQQQQTSVQH